MKILVAGGTAGAGLAIARLAAVRRHEVTVLARDPARGGGLMVGTRFVVGDALDADDVARAVAGQDAVVWAIGAPRGDAPADTLSRGTRLVVGAMSRRDVRRLIVVGGPDIPVRPGPFAHWRERFAGAPSARAIDEDRRAQEAILASSGLDWTLVRGAGPGARAGRRAGATAWRDALASFVVGELESPSHPHGTVAGPSAAG